MPSWYTSIKAASLGGVGLDGWMVPSPIFFQGHGSTVRADIVDYDWDFGDGSPHVKGFEAGHIYEVPGNYTVILTVTDALSLTATDTYPVVISARSGGTTYYVDSVLGLDSNAGTVGVPWKTATKAFSGMNTTGVYSPGDAILFNRGQTFDLDANVIRPTSGEAGYGYYFGAYGSGADPIIKHSGTSATTLIKSTDNKFGHIGFVDLEFDCTSSTGEVSTLFEHIANGVYIYFLRCEIHDFHQAIVMSGNYTTRIIHGVFIHDCNMHDSRSLFLAGSISCFSLQGNTFDMSNNHIAYMFYLDRAIVRDNTFDRWAFGRVALRVCGPEISDFSIVTNNVHVRENTFTGWIDPLTSGPEHGGGGTA